MITNNPDQFGYYQVGNQKFYSKFLAGQEHAKTEQPVRWCFNNEVFGAVNWQQEPSQSLSELYCQRAQQLREKYDYLVLWYSSGADSANILDSFVSNNIHLDEVASYVNFDADGDRYSYLNNEIFNSAVPRIEKIKQQQPWLIHTLIDISHLAIDFFSKKDSKFDWIYYLNSYLGPNTISRSNIKHSQPHWRRLINSGKTVCFIYGVDKPLVSAVKGQYWFYFRDMVDVAVSAAAQIRNLPGEFDELFYWTPDAPNIAVKQGHVIKNFIKLHKDKDIYFKGNYSSTVTVLDHRGKRSLDMDTLHRLIYPRWDPFMECIKPPSLIFTPRDRWFFALPDSDPAKYSWRTGLDHLWSTTPDSMKKDVTDISKGFKIIRSPMYYLGT